MSIEEVKKFVESWIVDAKKDNVVVIDKPIQICGVTLPDEVVGILKAHYFVECEERANQILQMLEDVDVAPGIDLPDLPSAGERLAKVIAWRIKERWPQMYDTVRVSYQRSAEHFQQIRQVDAGSV